MKITHITVKNFKSIKHIDFDIKRYGNSYTTVLVGVNESGKSSILEAMSYFKAPSGEFDYGLIHNQKDEKNQDIDLLFSLEFENKQTCRNELKKIIQEGGELLNFEVSDIQKNVYLEDGKKNFLSFISYEIKDMTGGLFIKQSQSTVIKNGRHATIYQYSLRREGDDEGTYEELTLETFKRYFKDNISEIITRFEPNVSLWRPSEEYLISNVDLNVFKDNIESNIPLKHIFYVAGFQSAESIKSAIEKISITSLRRRLAGTLGEQMTKYVQNIWKHKIKIDIEITDTGICSVQVCDEGEGNRFNYHSMSARSEGFKQFMSLILSLSIRTRMSNRSNDLILIDEPETHLHPSGIRDLRNELLAIGKDNYLFVSTHSPFLIDKKNKQRNIIIKKNSSAETQKVVIDEHTSFIDDEVLREAFGIEVYKDLLNPHSILVEGASDKKILQKAFKVRDLDGYGVTNGHGSNIDTLASKLNDTDIAILVVLDDDTEGRAHKEKVKKVGGSYSASNVFTIRDLVGALVDKGTIEDTLGNGFLNTKAQEVNTEISPLETWELTLTATSPVLEQIKVYLHQKGKNKQQIEKFLDTLKLKVANDFNPTRASLSRNTPLLNSLIDAMHLKMMG